LLREPIVSELRIVIADDEPLARRGLQQLLASHRDCTVVGECRNGRETVRSLRRLQPHVLFLDIQMPGLDGFQVLQSLAPLRSPAIVFVTAYDEFAVRAFETHALDYLLKPVSQERFDRTMQRIRDRARADRAAELSQELVTLLSTRGWTPGPGPLRLADGPDSAPAAVVVPTERGELVIDSAEIDWVQAEDYYAAVHALGRRHLIRESLSSLEKRLDPRQFVRIHRSALVRIDRIREICSPERGTAMVVLRDGTRVPISRRKRERVTALIRRR
jgi:two-component system LytT family response regulator